MNGSSKKRILIIDDAALVRTYYRSALEVRGFIVEEALNGLEGLEKVLLQPFDLAIVDVNMPQMDGITFLLELRSKALPVSGVPVLVISTEAGIQDIAAARRAGANYYLVKPIKQEVLAEYAAVFCGAPQ
ncbi:MULTISPECIES: response regulator [unclassified Bradyrhizobium]|uniref:response regulator n=1 Tax=unclassified Bradyrhizobium TaxID=2631580 RepID=UPI00040140B2|nr:MULTISPECIES: response regulator [unclassified Bradyrhizobium]QIG97353.1 response regulator [Bradyrhizobium sp. 6(2017)]